MDPTTIEFIKQLGDVADTLGMLGLMFFLLLVFIQGKIHSDKSVERQIAPYKDRLLAVDNGFGSRLERMEASGVQTEANTKRMADFLETMINDQNASRQRMTEATTKLTTLLETAQIQIPRRRR